MFYTPMLLLLRPKLNHFSKYSDVSRNIVQNVTYNTMVNYDRKIQKVPVKRCSSMYILSHNMPPPPFTLKI